jgi:hypothetical protein
MTDLPHTCVWPRDSRNKIFFARRQTCPQRGLNGRPCKLSKYLSLLNLRSQRQSSYSPGTGKIEMCQVNAEIGIGRIRNYLDAAAPGLRSIASEQEK